MAVDYSKWDKVYGVSKESVEGLDKNGKKEYVEVPYGQYEVKIIKLEMVASKKGEPMLSCWFEILAGDYIKNKIFMNQMLTTDYGIHFANEFLRSLDSNIDVVWSGYQTYSNLINKIAGAVEKLEYGLNFSCNSKGYSKFEIFEVYEQE